jgi:hypothetical protein
MPNGRCKVHGGMSTGPRTPEGLERSRRANWKHGHYSREAKAERSRVRAAILALRYLRMLGHSVAQEDPAYKAGRFKLGDHVRDRDSGIRGTVVYVPSDPALAGALIVRFSGSHNGLLVDDMCADRDAAQRRRLKWWTPI